MKLKFFYSVLLISLIVFSFSFFVFITSIEFNPIQQYVSKKTPISLLSFQGWAFFTRSPREAQVILYKVHDNKLFKVAHQHSSYKNYFGLSRSSTRIISELQAIKMSLGKDNFINTKWNYQKSLYGEIPNKIIDVKNQFKNPTLKGEYVLVFQRTVPWAWLESLNSIMMPAKIIRINVL